MVHDGIETMGFDRLGRRCSGNSGRPGLAAAPDLRGSVPLFRRLVCQTSRATPTKPAYTTLTETMLATRTHAAREPYLSVVVATRNDDHGGDPLKRLQAFVNCFDQQCRRTGLDAEVIVVEWNPPTDRPRVSSLLRLPERAACTYRFIDVPPELHGRLEFADVLPLFQMIAKNVGIRRAQGRFILVTNIDIIFSNELVEFLASRQLQAGVLYRVDRHDIQPNVPVDGHSKSRWPIARRTTCVCTRGGAPIPSISKAGRCANRRISSTAAPSAWALDGTCARAPGLGAYSGGRATLSRYTSIRSPPATAESGCLIWRSSRIHTTPARGSRSPSPRAARP